MKFFTADYHFGHPSILTYCGRKYSNIDKMTDAYIKDANQKTSEGDTIFHIGDFCNYGNEKGVPGYRKKATEYIKRFKANIVLLEGNHDSTNKVKTHMKCAIMDISNRWKNVSLGHYPSTYKEAEENFVRGTLRLCGHVHGFDSWKWCWDSENQILNINVGIDHWGHLVSVQDITVYVNRVLDRICLKNINWYNHLLDVCKRSFGSFVNQFPVGMPTHYCSGDRLKVGLRNQNPTHKTRKG